MHSAWNESPNERSSPGVSLYRGNECCVAEHRQLAAAGIRSQLTPTIQHKSMRQKHSPQLAGKSPIGRCLTYPTNCSQVLQASTTLLRGSSELARLFHWSTGRHDELICPPPWCQCSGNRRPFCQFLKQFLHHPLLTTVHFSDTSFLRNFGKNCFYSIHLPCSPVSNTKKSNLQASLISSQQHQPLQHSFNCFIPSQCFSTLICCLCPWFLRHLTALW